MADSTTPKPSRRTFLKRTAAVGAVAAAGLGAAGYWLGSVRRVSRSIGKKVIVIGIDGMDPRLSERMMKAGQLPNLAKLRAAGGFSDLGTSIPPQSPVAWANFINGAGPGSHGIFDFIHRHPQEQCAPFFSAAETVGGQTLLRRQGTPFWDYLDAAGVPSTFYDLPSNYPASPSHHGHHRCISGMGTPDMLGSYGTYQHFAENGPPEPTDEPEGGGKRPRLVLEHDTAKATIICMHDPFLKNPQETKVEFLVHRDVEADAAVIEIQGRKLVLKAGQWSPWIRVDFSFSLPLQGVPGICRI